jgi:hypothetical protein
VVRHLANARTVREDGGTEIPSSEYPLRVARQSIERSHVAIRDRLRCSRSLKSVLGVRRENSANCIRSP